MRTLIGRDHPADVLRAEIGRTADGHGGLVLVTGEAGIGKTTLVTGAVEDARELGALVLSGSCWDSESAPGFWPWVQVVRGLRRSATPEEWAAAEDAAGSNLAVLLGDSTSTAAAEGFELYDAVTTALVSASQSRPVVVVLDDLHWADTASLKLLEFAARHTWFERLLLVGAYRDVEVESDEHPLQPLFTPLMAKATTVTLTGLGRTEVGTLMARTVGQEPDEDLVTEVHRRTGGNPFFVEQTARLWHSGGSVTAIAAGVRDALRRRLSLLPTQVVRLLTGAAVLGQEFHRQVLAAVVAAPVPQVDRLLDQAVAVRLVSALGGGRFAFAHDLIRETLYDSLDEADVRKRHAAAVGALDRAPTIRERILPADLARHAYLAGTDLEPGRAMDHLVAAARDATRRLANEEAIGHYRRALELAGQHEPRRQVLIALDLGGMLHHAGDREEAWSHAADATTIARTLDEPELLARVALTCYRLGGPDERGQLKADLLNEALGTLVGDGSGGDTAAPDGLMSLDGLAKELTAHVTMRARRGGDDEALGFSLWALHDSIWGLGTAAERETLTYEIADLARRTSDHEMEQFATSLGWVALLEQGDPRYLDQLHTFVAMVKRAGQPRMVIGSLMDQSIIATLMGRFDEAQDFFDQAVNFPEDQDHDSFMFLSEHVRWALLLLQGRFDELDDLQRELAKSDYPLPRLLEAVTAVQRGDVDVALRYLAEEQPHPRYFIPLWLRFQAQVAAAAQDPELCEQARTALVPYRGQWLIALFGCEVSGPVVFWLAVLDAAQGRWDDAIAGFTAAQRSADLLHARPWSIEARAGLATALLARGSSGDRAAGTTLLDEVERDAAEIGMRHIIDRTQRIRSTMAATTTPAPREATANEFRFDGDVWSLTMDGRTVHVPDAKGLHDLHALLSQPGTDIPAVRLLNPAGGDVVVAARRMGGDDILDEEAKAQYKRRLARLDEEIDQAAQRGDDDRAAEFDRERQTLLNELRAAAGLAGRDRRLGDEAERARKTVTARIRDTLRKLDQRHPELAAHLRATISTGATCHYQPASQIRWRL